MKGIGFVNPQTRKLVELQIAKSIVPNRKISSGKLGKCDVIYFGRSNMLGQRPLDANPKLSESGDTVGYDSERGIWYARLHRPGHRMQELKCHVAVVQTTTL